MKNRIGKRLVRSFLLIILLTVVTIDIFLLIGFKSYYYNNVENELRNRLNLSLELYNRDYTDKNLDTIVLDDTDLLWSHTNAQVQLLDKAGNVIMDSIGAIYREPIKTNDFLAAKGGQIKSSVGVDSVTKNSVMAITGVIKDINNNEIGYLRFISSMEEANLSILKTMLTLVLFSIIVVGVTILFSLLLSKSIVKPILELTDVARKMAGGQYKVKANVWEDDEIGELAKTLNIMSEEIVKKDQIKNDFISSISHELRTPLTSIKGWAVVLKGAKPDEKDLLADGLNIIENESDRLSKMVEELLDFSRFISGRISLNKETFNIAKTCLDVSKQMRPKANSNKIDFQTDLLDDIEIIIGDENRIKQLLINILDNAIKFTSKNGWVRFNTFVEEKDYNKRNFIILVSDNGVGMNKEDLMHVKEKFYKGKHSKSHSGIGLSISDEIAKLHNGNLEIFSEENIGTTVKVTIPMNFEEKVV